ncbi:MAG: hypothetical protein O3B87_05880 [bacterium]|nr:hypothetical protein [bacterium]
MSFLKSYLPQKLIEYIQNILAMQSWKRRGYLDNAPQNVKESVFHNYGIPNAAWVETGTYYGTSTKFFSKNFPHVYSIEPSSELYQLACDRFGDSNVTFFNDVSENILCELLPTLSGNLNFWLDGHYSAGVTFKGSKDCPVEDELNAIEENINNFDKVTILIDDVRCFLPATSIKYDDYPSIDYLVDWARKFNMRWRIEHDIFIMQKD